MKYTIIPPGKVVRTDAEEIPGKGLDNSAHTRVEYDEGSIVIVDAFPNGSVVVSSPNRHLVFEGDEIHVRKH